MAEDKKIIDLIDYQKEECEDKPSSKTPVSDELSVAIEHLIQRLRENKPL